MLKIKEPKFKLNQKVYYIEDNRIMKGEIRAFDIFTMRYLIYFWFYEEDKIFATQEEAEAKLKEIGEKQ